jgi:hypothetical protein
MIDAFDDVCSVAINAKTTVHCSPDFSMDLQIYLNPGFSFRCKGLHIGFK